MARSDSYWKLITSLYIEYHIEYKASTQSPEEYLRLALTQRHSHALLAMCHRANRLALRGCVTTSYTLFLYWGSPRATRIWSLPFNALAANSGALQSRVSWCTCHVICHELGCAMESSTFTSCWCTFHHLFGRQGPGACLLMHLPRHIHEFGRGVSHVHSTNWWCTFHEFNQFCEQQGPSASLLMHLARHMPRTRARYESCSFQELVMHMSRTDQLLGRQGSPVCFLMHLPRTRTRCTFREQNESLHVSRTQWVPHATRTWGLPFDTLATNSGLVWPNAPKESCQIARTQ